MRRHTAVAINIVIHSIQIIAKVPYTKIGSLARRIEQWPKSETKLYRHKETGFGLVIHKNDSTFINGSQAITSTLTELDLGTQPKGKGQYIGPSKIMTLCFQRHFGASKLKSPKYHKSSPIKISSATG
jgi:hypothetical protein